MLDLHSGFVVPSTEAVSIDETAAFTVFPFSHVHLRIFDGGAGGVHLLTKTLSLRQYRYKLGQVIWVTFCLGQLVTFGLYKQH